MRFLRTNTAVRLTVGPFFDKTDGVTPETGLTVTSCKLTLMVDDGNVPTLVLDASATASGGNNDMVHVTGDDAGFYDLELTAANLNYLGRAMLAITDAATHCPVFHEFMILPAAVYDSLVLGTDTLPADVTQIGGDTQSATDLKDFADAGYDPSTNKVQGVVLVDTLTTYTGNTVQTGDSFARLTGTGAVTFASLTVTGSTSLAALSTSGTVTLNALTVTNATTLTGIVNASNASNTILLGTNMITSSTIATDAIGAGELAASAITEIQSGLATSSALTSAQSDITAILADTNELQTDWANGGRLDLILDAMASQTSVDDLPTNAELATALGTADDAVLAAIAALNNLSAADVNAQVLDCLATDTYAEPGQGTPAATTTLAVKINYLYKLMRNKFTQTSTTQNFYADDASTVDHKATVSDDGSTFTRGEIASGP